MTAQPLDDFYADVATIALAAGHRHGFVLGGGVAWLVNGLVRRHTEDIDLFTDTAGAVEAAAAGVTSALTAAGYQVFREVGDEMFEGMDEDLREYHVADGRRALRLTLTRLDRRRAPVVMDVGPVLHLDDLIGSKVAALVNRREVRDYIDVAAALERYPLERVLALAHALDPGLEPDEIADAGRYLDRLDDARFAVYGLGPAEVAAVRARLSAWPR